MNIFYIFRVDILKPQRYCYLNNDTRYNEMNKTDAVYKTVSELIGLWPQLEGATLADIDKAISKRKPALPNKGIAAIGLSIYCKLYDEEWDAKSSEHDADKLISEASANNQFNSELNRNVEVYRNGLFEALAWVLEDDIDQVLFEYAEDEATRKGL